MKRRLFTILSALSLLLFVAVVVLWVRSYWMTDHLFGGTRGGRAWDLYSTSGTLSFTATEPYPVHRDVQLHTYPHGAARRQPDEYVLAFVASRLAERRWAGVEWAAGQGDLLKFAHGAYDWRFPPPANPVTFWYVRAKYGHAFLAAATALPAIPGAVRLLRRYRQRRLRRRGLCPSCGYDLRATPGRCPECGLFPAAPPPP
jgi:hypothetical protein